MSKICFKIWIIAALLMGAVSAKAEINFGVKAGGEVYHLWNTSGDFSSVQLGVGGGFFTRFTFLGILGIQPELLYLQKGGKYSKTFENQDVFNSDSTLIHLDLTVVQTRTTKINSLNLPVLIKLYAPGFIAVKPNLFFGPYYAYQLGDRKVESTAVGSRDGQIYSGKGFHKYLDTETGEDNPHELGAVLGLGIDFGLGTFDLRYVLGLSQIEKEAAPGKEKEELQTGVLFLSFGFLF